MTVGVTDILGQTDTQNISMTINPAPTITTGFAAELDRHLQQLLGDDAGDRWDDALHLGPPQRHEPAAGTDDQLQRHHLGQSDRDRDLQPHDHLADKTGVTTSRSYTVTINSLPSITGPPTLPSPWTAGNPYTATTVTATNGTTAYKWAASGLPTGMTIAQGTGVISGTPTVAGTYSSLSSR